MEEIPVDPSVQLSRVWLFVTPWSAAHQASLSLTISRSLLKLPSIESVMPSNHLILCRPLLLLPPVFPSIRVFSNELALLITWPKFWSFSWSISPSNEYSGWIFFRIDWFDYYQNEPVFVLNQRASGKVKKVLQCGLWHDFLWLDWHLVACLGITYNRKEME